MREALFQEAGDFGSGGEPIGRFFGEQLVDQGGEPGGYVSIDLANGTGLRVGDSSQHTKTRIRAEGRAAGTHGVHHAAQAE